MLDTRVFRIIESIISTSSRLGKEDILRNCGNCEDFKKVMKFVFSPYVTTGIGRKKLDKFITTCALSERGDLTWDDLIARFTNTTGTDEDCRDAAIFVTSTPVQYAWIMEDIITKKLTIGVTSKTLNKVYGEDFIPVIGCMLGTSIKDVSDKYKKGKWIVTEKLDGQRKYIVKDHDGTTTIYSGRKGMLDNDYPDIHMDAAKLPSGFVYDGEILAEGEFDNCIAQRQATSAICGSKGSKTGVKLHVFDMIKIDDFKRGYSDKMCAIRKTESIRLLRELKLKHIDYVPVIRMLSDCDLEDIQHAAEVIWNRGGEGVMLNRADAPYEVKRVKHLLKVKYNESYDLRIIGMTEGTVGTKNEGRLGAFVVSYKGYEVGVGSGLDDYIRVDAWNNPEKYIGKICEVTTFGESKNADGGLSLNAPIFMGMRYDKDDADY